MRDFAFTKGHGTKNDFVLVPDLDGSLGLTVSDARWFADRRAGIGGDGVIRIVPTEAASEPDVAAQAAQARWFMDYRNADGSLAEMCGNGARVFAAYLRREGLESSDEFAIATRGGVRVIRIEGDQIVVGMGAWRIPHADEVARSGRDALVHVTGVDPLSAVSVDLGNPHTVAALPEAVPLAHLDLSQAPQVNPEPAHGTNVEFVRPLGPGHISMRVYERGVGETSSCGTGACAAALATSFWATDAVEDDQLWLVDVPGGRLQVRFLAGSQVELSGPAELVADGVARLP